MRPPPGVSSGDECATHDRHRDRAPQRARARVRPLRRVAGALERGEDGLLVSVRDARAAVDDAHLHGVADPSGGDAHLGGPVCCQGVLDDVGQHSVEQPEIRAHEGQVRLGDTSTRPGSDVVRTVPTTASSRSTEWWCGRTEPVSSRERSSRLPMSPSRRSADSSIDSSSSASSSGDKRARAAKDRHRRLDARERRAKVMRHRGEQRRAGGVVAGQRRACRAAAPVAHGRQDRSVRGVRVDEALVLGGHGRPVEEQVDIVVDLPRPPTQSPSDGSPRQEARDRSTRAPGRGGRPPPRSAWRDRIPRASRARSSSTGSGRGSASRSRLRRRARPTRARRTGPARCGAATWTTDDDGPGDEHEDEQGEGVGRVVDGQRCPAAR